MKRTSKRPSISKKASQSKYFQNSIVTATALLFTLMVYWPIKRFVTSDPLPTINALTPERITEFSPKTRVTVGLMIKDFPTFNIRENDLVFDGVVSFDYDPNETNTETLSLFTFDRGEIVHKSQNPAIRTLRNNRKLAYYTVRVKLHNNMDYRLFPFDDHRLSIIIQNPNVSPSDIIFEAGSNNFVIDTPRYLDAWQQVGTHVEPGYTEENLELIERPSRQITYPTVLFSIDYSRFSYRALIVLLFPLFAIFLLLLFSLMLLEVKWYIIRLSMLVGALSSLIAYLFIAENISPRVGYFMIHDYLYIFIVTITILFFMATLSPRKIALNFRAFINIVVCVGFILLWTYLLYIYPYMIMTN